jgi:hypothetical protein
VQDALARQMPYVSEVRGEPLPGACRLYGWGDRDPLAFFVMFQADRHEDAFTVEIGWSKDGHWPQAFKLKPPDPTGNETSGARFRLGRLWMDTDVWWTIDEGRAGLDLSTQVKSAVCSVATQGAEYLGRIRAFERLRRSPRPS